MAADSAEMLESPTVGRSVEWMVEWKVASWDRRSVAYLAEQKVDWSAERKEY